MTSKVGSISTKHTFLSNFPLSINFKAAYFTSLLQHKNIIFFLIFGVKPILSIYSICDEIFLPFFETLRLTPLIIGIGEIYGPARESSTYFCLIEGVQVFSRPGKVQKYQQSLGNLAYFSQTLVPTYHSWVNRVVCHPAYLPIHFKIIQSCSVCWHCTFRVTSPYSKWWIRGLTK
jgi:hypothetical protein